MKEHASLCVFSAVMVVVIRDLKERLSISVTFTSNGKREFVPRDQVSPLLVAYCSLFLQID